MNEKTLFVSDLDGTLMRGDETLSAYTVQAVNRLIEQGMAFTYATARSIESARVITGGLRMKLPVITRNGAVLADNATGKHLEKALFNGGLKAEDLPAAWNDLYEKYLGIRPDCDRNGVLQDVHWTDCLGYFPTYALGNFYGGMYLSRMQEEFDPFESLSEHGFKKINSWMAEHVFAKANRREPADWIRNITGRELTATDYLDYLERKYL